jgi:MoxR-like ATPase
VAAFEKDFESGLEGLTENDVSARMVAIERILGEWRSGRKFYGHMFDDVLTLKYLHQRYSNYLRWLRWKET